MQAQLSEGGKFLGTIRIEPTCSTSLACCEISFILLISAVPLGSNFAFAFGAASNVLAIASSSLDSVMGDSRITRENATSRTRRLRDTHASQVCLRLEFFAIALLAAALRSSSYTTSI
jgi:hypothetical protein